MITCRNNNRYVPGQMVKSIVFHSSLLQIGTVGKVLSTWAGRVFAVEASNGELHRWFDQSELQSLNPNDPQLVEGINAMVVSKKAHYNIRNGEIVKIVKIIEGTDYYELDVAEVAYRQWVAGFELTTVL